MSEEKKIQTKTEKQIEMLQWEITLLTDQDYRLRQNGRENAYNNDKRIGVLRMRLDHLLGFHEPKESDEP